MELNHRELNKKKLAGAIVNSPVWREIVELAELVIGDKTKKHLSGKQIDFESSTQAEGIKQFIKEINRWTQREFSGESYNYTFGEQKNAE